MWPKKKDVSRISACVCVCPCVLSHSVVSDFATPWTVAHQAPLSMEFSRQEYRSGLPFPPPGIFPTQGSNPCSFCFLHWQVGFFTTRATWKALGSVLTPHQTNTMGVRTGKGQSIFYILKNTEIKLSWLIYLYWVILEKQDSKIILK